LKRISSDPLNRNQQAGKSFFILVRFLVYKVFYAWDSLLKSVA